MIFQRLAPFFLLLLPFWGVAQTLEIGVNQFYTLNQDTLKVDRLIMRAGAVLKLNKEAHFIYADEIFFGKAATINGRGAPGEPGSAGRPGRSASSENCGSGQDGFPGRDGQDGQPGATLLLNGNLKPLHELSGNEDDPQEGEYLVIDLRGGRGGDGGQGGRGGKGFACCGERDFGGDGGRGGFGGAGGSGGVCYLFAKNDEAPRGSVQILTEAGEDGRPGLPGEGGPCTVSKNCFKSGWGGDGNPGPQISNPGSAPGKSNGTVMRAYFPENPPRPSASDILIFDHSEISTFRDLDDRLKEALDQAGYIENRYYLYRDGFALVTRMERMNPDGTPPESGRFDLEGPGSFSLFDYIKAIFQAPEGYFRIIVFLVSNKDVVPQGTISKQAALEWFNSGMLALPKSLRDHPFSAQHDCTALIYEFRKSGPSSQPILNQPSVLRGGRVHLNRAGIMAGLDKE